MVDQILVRTQNNYGADVIYPVCQFAKAFALIAKTETLTAGTLKLIQGMHVKIVVQTPELSL